MSEEVIYVCQGCQKKYSINELEYSYINERFFCPKSNCTYAVFELKLQEKRVE